MTTARQTLCIVCDEPAEMPFAGLLCIECAAMFCCFSIPAIADLVHAAFERGEHVRHRRLARLLAHRLRAEGLL